MRASRPVGENVSPHVRLAVPGDSARIADAIRAAFAEYSGILVPESAALRETSESISSELRGGSAALVAEQNGLVLGCVMIQTIGSDLYLGRLAVRPSARRQGIGRVLVEAVEELARRRRHEGVRLGVRVQLASNRHFFSELGYREVARTAHAGFDHPTSITMRKALAA
ncbi:GNAT family N-acetyltransferase [Actinomycetes bacterium KLBMP 9759]